MNKRPRYEKYSKVKEVYDVSPETLRNWARRGSIRYKCVQNEHNKTWLYDIESIGEYLQNSTDKIEGEEEKLGKRPIRVIYTRVSSIKQKADLERQQELLLSAYPDAKVIQDIGSGINFHRPGFSKLVRDVCRDRISNIVVTYKDRIARFGYELFEQVCKEHGTTILVHSQINRPTDDNEELKDDLLSIINVFVASNNGKRAAMLKKERKALAQRNSESEAISKGGTEKETEVDV